MKWLERAITEFFFRPCWKFGNSGFWETLLFGRHPAQMQDQFETFRGNGPLVVRSSAGRDDDIEWIEVRTHNGSYGSRSRERLEILAVKATEHHIDKHVSKKEYSR